jgi:hypothetical protein
MNKPNVDSGQSSTFGIGTHSPIADPALARSRGFRMNKPNVGSAVEVE